MAFCANCGAPVDGRFCRICGAAQRADASPPGDPQPYTNPSGLTDNAASALCYVLGFITGILFLVLEPYSRNRTVRFHAFQSIFLNVAWIVVWFALNVVLGTLFRAAGFFIGLELGSLVGLGFFVLWIYMIVSAYQGKKMVLPVIGPLAEQQA